MRTFLKKFNHVVLGFAIYSLGLQPAFANLERETQLSAGGIPRPVLPMKTGLANSDTGPSGKAHISVAKEREESDEFEDARETQPWFDDETYLDALGASWGKDLRAIPGINVLTGAELSTLGLWALNATLHSFLVQPEKGEGAQAFAARSYRNAETWGLNLVRTSTEFMHRFKSSFFDGLSFLLKGLRAGDELDSRQESSPGALAKEVAQLESELEESRATLSRVFTDALQSKGLGDDYIVAKDKIAFLNEHLTQSQRARIKAEIQEQRAIAALLKSKRPFDVMDDKKVAGLEKLREAAVTELNGTVRGLLEAKGLWTEWSELVDEDRPAFLVENLDKEEKISLARAGQKVQALEAQLGQVLTTRFDVTPEAIYNPLGEETAAFFLREFLRPVLDQSRAVPVLAVAQAHGTLTADTSRFAEKNRTLKKMRKALYDGDGRAKLLYQAVYRPSAHEEDYQALAAREGIADAEPLTQAEQARLKELEDFRFWWMSTFDPSHLKFRSLVDVDALVNKTPTWHTMNWGEVEDEEAARPSVWSRFMDTRVGKMASHPLFWGAMGLGALAYSGWDPIGPIGPRGAEAAMTTGVGGLCEPSFTIGCKRVVNGTNNLCYENSPACCPNPAALSGIPGNGTGTVTITAALPGFDANGFPFGAEVFYPVSLSGWQISSQTVGENLVLSLQGNLSRFDQDFGCVQEQPGSSILYFQPKDSDRTFNWRMDVSAGTESVSATNYFIPVPNNDPPTIVQPFAFDPSVGNDRAVEGVRSITGVVPFFPFELHDIDGAQMDNPPELQGMKVVRGANFALTRGGAPFPPNSTLAGSAFRDGSVGYAMTCDPLGAAPSADYVFCDYQASTADCVPGSETSIQTWSQPCPPAADPQNVVVSSPPLTPTEKFLKALQVIAFAGTGVTASGGIGWGILTWVVRNDLANNPLPALIFDKGAIKKFRTDVKSALVIRRICDGFKTLRDPEDRFDVSKLIQRENGGYIATEHLAKAMASVLLQEAKISPGCLGGRFSFYMLKLRSNDIDFEGLLNRMDDNPEFVSSLAMKVVNILKGGKGNKTTQGRSGALCCCRTKSLNPSNRAWNLIQSVAGSSSTDGRGPIPTVDPGGVGGDGLRYRGSVPRHTGDVEMSVVAEVDV